MVRTIYQQLSPAEVHGQLDRVVEQLREAFAQVADVKGGGKTYNRNPTIEPPMWSTLPPPFTACQQNLNFYEKWLQ